MSSTDPIDQMQYHFDYLDGLVNARLRGGDQEKRGPVVMALPVLDRDLYFVCDVIAISCNAGMGAWVDFHIDDEGWIDDAARAFEAIGHRTVSDALKACRERYLSVKGDLEAFRDEELSRSVWHAEDALYMDLHRHLVAGDFSFQRRAT